MSSMFGGGLFGSMFADDDAFFGGGFGSSSSMMSMMSMEPGTSTSRQSTTFIQNGKRITKTTTTKRYADGRVETHVRCVGCMACSFAAAASTGIAVLGRVVQEE